MCIADFLFVPMSQVDVSRTVRKQYRRKNVHILKQKESSQIFIECEWKKEPPFSQFTVTLNATSMRNPWQK